MAETEFSDYIRVFFVPENDNEPLARLEHILKPNGSHIDEMQTVYKLRILFNYVFMLPTIRDIGLNIDIPDGSAIDSVVISAKDGSDTPVNVVNYILFLCL